MCWIFWYKWKKNSLSIICLWLKRLEYRWYDSSWISLKKKWVDEIETIKSIWPISNLIEKIDKLNINKIDFEYWIWHTRRATHWKVNLENAHPHFDSKKEIILVHNWIIENCEKLKNMLIKNKFSFYWDTDSEVIVKLLEYNWQWDLLKTVEKTLPMLEWAYSFLIISKKSPWEMIWVKYWSQLYFWFDESDMYFSSDINALKWFCENIIYLNDWELIYISNSDFIVKSEWKLISKSIEKANIQNIQTEKWEFKHFMKKEIFEQPSVVERIFKWRIDFENNSLNCDFFYGLDKMSIEKIMFVWCWTSFNAWLYWEYLFNNYIWIDSSCDIASEFEYKRIYNNKNCLYIFISQSWETADTISCLKTIKNMNLASLWIVNVVWSTISRLTDFWLFSRADTEIGVAATKTFTSQIVCIIIIWLYFAKKKWINKWDIDKIIWELKLIPQKIQNILDQDEFIRNIASDLSKYNNFFFLWRWIDLPIAKESSLKLKEISYIHSESYPSWELKHWPIALIDEKFPTILFCPNNSFFKKNLSTLQEIKSRNWKIITISDLDIKESNFNIKIDKTIDIFYPILNTICWQLLAYNIADILWNDIDKPKNLAKSVTVK